MLRLREDLGINVFALQLITSFIRVLDQNFNIVFKAGLGYVRPCRKKMGGKGFLPCFKKKKKKKS